MNEKTKIITQHPLVWEAYMKALEADPIDYTAQVMAMRKVKEDLGDEYKKYISDQYKETIE